MRRIVYWAVLACCTVRGDRGPTRVSITELTSVVGDWPLIVSDIFDAWPELSAARDEMNQMKFSIDGVWANATVHVPEYSRWGSAREARWLETHENRPFNLFVKPINQIVNETLQHLRFSIPQPLKEIRHIGPFLSLGTRRQSNPVHTHEAATFFQIWGTKSWIMHAPDFSWEQIPDKLKEPTQICDYVRSKKKNDGRSELMFDLQEGTALYVPEDWHHSTCNKADWNVGISFQGPVGDFPPYFRAVLDKDRDAAKFHFDKLSQHEAMRSLQLIVDAGIAPGPWKQELLHQFLEPGGKLTTVPVEILLDLAKDACHEDDLSTFKILLDAAKRKGANKKKIKRFIKETALPDISTNLGVKVEGFLRDEYGFFKATKRKARNEGQDEL